MVSPANVKSDGSILESEVLINQAIANGWPLDVLLGAEYLDIGDLSEEDLVPKAKQ